MSKVRLEGFVLIPHSDLETVLNELPAHIANSRAEQGCLKFDVTQDNSNLCRLNVQEEFIDMLAFEKHQKRVENSDWGKITYKCTRHYEIHKAP